MNRCCVLLIAVLAPASVAAQSRANANGRAAETGSTGLAATATMASALRASPPPVLDGRTDDAIWSQAQVIDKFLEYEPTEGAETRFKTEARVAYDDRYLYVLVRMFDPRPDSIVSLLSRRDVRTQSEQVKLVIDSYHDRRTAYQFAVNPAGVKRDFYVYDDDNEDPSWDGVWDVATAIDSVGWVAEFRIPFGQLRFASKAEHTFGMLIVRDIARTNARISWPLFKRGQQGYVSQAGDVAGIRNVPTPRRLEVTPYVVAKDVNKNLGPDRYSRGQKLTTGADVKYGLSSNLTLDATINPDFGQVEADPAVLNLSAFETFFNEQRPFFLEGTGIFSFNVNCGDIDSGCTGLFYSRRIGRSPQLLGVYGAEGSASATSILGAGKVTGRLGNGLSLGTLAAVAQREVGSDDQTTEPRTLYAVSRLTQSFNDNQSDVGVMLTGVNRELDEFTDPYMRRDAYTGGVDVRHRFLKNNYEMRAYLAGSIVRGNEDAIALLQRCTGFGCTHSFQRPDDNQEYDPSRTQLAGNAQRISISKFGGGVTRFQSVYQRYSHGFDINDVGFLRRDDEQMFRNWFALQFNKPGRFHRRANFNFNHWSNWTSEGLPTNFGFNQNSHVELKNTWWVHAGMNAGNFTKTYLDREARGGPAVRRSADSEVWGGLEMDRRSAVQPFFFVGVWRNDGGRTHGTWYEPSVNFRAKSRLSASLGLYYEDLVDDNQFTGNFGVLGNDTTHYTFARLAQRTLSMTSRINFTATPALSLQVYAQPFLTKGDYENWRQLSDTPRADEYDDRYEPYVRLVDHDDDPATPVVAADPGGFAFKQFRSNTVLRWEYRPGSTLFLVWTQGREGSGPNGNGFAPGQEYRDLFRQHPDNTFLVKASYWFNY